MPSGTYTFTNFWKGNYNLTVNKYGYTLIHRPPISIMGDMTINVTLLQIKAPPTGLHIPDTTLLATWFPPVVQTMLFNEPFKAAFCNQRMGSGCRKQLGLMHMTETRHTVPSFTGIPSLPTTASH